MRGKADEYPCKCIDLSSAGELSKLSCQAMGALLAHNTSVTSLNLSKTKLGDEAGDIKVEARLFEKEQQLTKTRHRLGT